MSGTTTLLSYVCLIFWATVLLPEFGKAQSVQQTSVSTSCATDPQCMTGNGYHESTHLKAHDRVVIKATEVDGPLYGQCRSVLNNGGKDLFLPWRTPPEWTAFLNTVSGGNLPNVSLASCCAPQNATVCGNPVYYADGVTPIPLGYRTLGVLSGDTTPTANWGAETDILGPLSAPAPLNYQVTYVCENGAWVKTREVGSCTPTNGYCSALNGTYVADFPTDPTTYTATLCAAGSTFDTTVGLTTTSTGWSWQCDGTQGMPTATCTAYNHPPVNGTCGPNSANDYNYTPDTLGQLEAMPQSSICSSGVWNGSFSDNGGISPYWTWSCEGQYGGSNSGQCYVIAASFNGSCGIDNGMIFSLGQSPGPQANLCQYGGPGTVPLFNPVTNTWTWTCTGSGSGAISASCSATYNPGYTNGLCGSDNGGYFAPGTLSSSDPNLCSAGTAQDFTYNPAGSPAWQWLCQGSDGGSQVSCSAQDIPAVNGQCGSDSGTTMDTLSSADPNLCTAGTPGNFNEASTQWTWSCNGIAGGSTASCAANKNMAISGATCGPAAGTSSATSPAASTLCSLGNPSGVSTSQDGTQWLWTCTSVDGTSTASCSATVTPPFANGVCGATNNTAIPNTPNYNLCASGTSSAITGTGPWSWTCLGTSGGTNSPTCTAFLCNACAGTVTSSQSTGQSGTTSTGCNIVGTASWTETDALIPGAANTETISWTDDAGAFSWTVIPQAAAWPTYCPPCYTQAQSVSGAGLTITGLSGTCGGYSIGQVLPASGVSVSP